MQHFNTIVEDIEQLSAFLCADNIRQAARASRSALIQLYAGQLHDARLEDAIRVVRRALPQAVIVGATSASEISQGHVVCGSLVISIAFFRSSTLDAVTFDCAQSDEYSVGRTIAAAFHAVPDLQGILLLAPVTRVNCTRLLQGIQNTLPGVRVFGGGAAEIQPERRSFVLHHAVRSETQCVAVALSGAELHIETHASLGWKAIGPRMTLTDVQGFQVRGIDGEPAIGTYRKYLGIGDSDDDIYLLEFPLLIERLGMQIARNPVARNADGGVTLVADVYQGETARLGYLDVDAVVAALGRVRHSLEAFWPEAIFVYSCICRRFTLQEDIECETRPLQAAAPVAGFCTNGEFCEVDGHLQVLNSSQVTVAMREGPARQTARPAEVATVGGMERYRFRHARITSRLLQSITALSEEVQQANFQLRYEAEHDCLTGALNRRALDLGLEAEISRSERYRRPLAVVLLDLDHFKQLNDAFGHAAGDYVLAQLVATIRRMTRDSDALYRYGGEEFVLLLPEAAHEGALGVAENVRAAVEEMCLAYEGKPLPAVTISLGISCYPQHGRDGLSLLKAADGALYQSKARGRNRVSMAQ